MVSHFNEKATYLNNAIKSIFTPILNDFYAKIVPFYEEVIKSCLRIIRLKQLKY